MSAPLSVEVRLPVEGEPVATDSRRREFVVVRAAWYAAAVPDMGRVIVDVTALAGAPTYTNTTWREHDTDRPTWLPQPPEWFWAAVRDMRTAMESPEVEASLARIDAFSRANPGSSVTS